jgi:hypothetical protein
MNGPTDRETGNRRIDKWANVWIVRRTCRKMYGWVERQTKELIDIYVDRKTKKQKNRKIEKTEKQLERKADRSRTEDR